MNVFICLDDNYGMMFNKRRQSKDSQVRQKMLSLAEGSRLWMNSYSAGQFDQADSITVDENFLNIAAVGEFCFVENLPIDLQKVGRLFIFWWNRRYPSDLKFDADLSDFESVSVEEFVGTSHEKITLEVFERK